MNRRHLAPHFDAYVGELLRRLKPEERKSWKYVIADSYETGLQNWTDGLRGDFQKTYGYDPQPYLPALGGRVVGSADVTDRFLWDLRRLVADRIARDYVGGLRDLTRAQGMKLWLENYGHFGFPSEFLLYGAYTDEVSGEFWLGRNKNVVEVRAASSAAHIYGKSPVWSEAFTARNLTFQTTPRDLKAQGDWSFCEGINQFVLHVYIHQPDEQKPGLNAWFGTEFNRHNTWFGKSKSWIDYLRRCSVMLQTGRPVADFAVFITEDAPKMTGPKGGGIPAGHDYDFINADAILHRLTVRDGHLVLPDGTRYAALVLPDSATMRPAVARKLQELAKAGAKIIGSKPTRSPSLQNHPACDAETRELATWKALPNAAALGLQPDVTAPADMLWKHRQTPDLDIYFLSNQSSNERTETLSFRTTGRPASLWNAVNSEIHPVAHTEANGRSSITLRLPPQGSIFVVFGAAVPGGAVADAPSSPGNPRLRTVDRRIPNPENHPAGIGLLDHPPGGRYPPPFRHGGVCDRVGHRPTVSPGPARPRPGRVPGHRHAQRHLLPDALDLSLSGRCHQRAQAGQEHPQGRSREQLEQPPDRRCRSSPGKTRHPPDRRPLQARCPAAARRPSRSGAAAPLTMA